MGAAASFQTMYKNDGTTAMPQVLPVTKAEDLCLWRDGEQPGLHGDISQGVSTRIKFRYKSHRVGIPKKGMRFKGKTKVCCGHEAF